MKEIILLGALILTTSAFAEGTSQMKVSANIEKGCSLFAESLVNFGEVKMIDKTIKSGPIKDVQVNIRCSKGVSYSVKNNEDLWDTEIGTKKAYAIKLVSSTSNIPLIVVAFYKDPNGFYTSIIENQQSKVSLLREGFTRVANAEVQDLGVQMLLYPQFLLYNTAPNPGNYIGQTTITVTY